MSGLSKQDLEFIEFMEKSYSKQKRNAFIEGALIGIVLGLVLAMLIILIIF